MAKPTNKDKELKVDESILDETPPNINEPQDKEDEEPIEEEVIEEDEEKEEEKIDEEPKEKLQEKENKSIEEEKETDDQKEKRIKAQQTEAQILVARNKSLTDKVDEASKIADPTEEELKSFVAQDGADWDDLSAFEKSMAKKTYLSEKRFSLVNEAVQVTRKIDEWAGKVDEFLDSIEGKPEFVKLSGHESDFRKFAMKESHRGVEIQTLLVPAFVQNILAPVKKRGSLFETGGGGDKPDNPAIISDTDTIRSLRETNPREYRRQVKAGKIKVEA